MHIIWHMNHSKTSLLNTVFTLLPSCSKGSPPSLDSVESYGLNRACCQAWQTTAEKKAEKGGIEKREKQGRRGSERYSSKSIEARQIQWRNPPSSQMNISACLLSSSPPPSPSLGFFVPSSSLGPLHYSLACSQSRPHCSSCRSSRSTDLLPPAFTFPPSSARQWRLQAGPFLLLRRKASPH